MNNYQAQQDLNSIIGFATSIIFMGFLVGMVRNFSGTPRKKRLWVVYYGKDVDGKIGWHAYEEHLWSGARAWIDAVLKRGWAKEAYAIEAPTRYQAIKIAKQQHPEDEIKRLPSSQSISSTYLKRLREATTKVREADYSLESMAERGKLLDEIVNGKQRMMAIYLFDANHWLEKVGETCDEAIEVPSSEYESYEGIALSHLDESLSYYNTCYRSGWITEVEFKDMERYFNELVVFIENHDWEKACGRVGDADRLAKIILADRLKKV